MTNPINTHTTWIEINQTALQHNIAQYRSWLPAKTNIMAMVKANAYGHGAAHVGSLLEHNPLVAKLCVANSYEALQLRRAGVTKPIVIMGFVNTALTAIAQYNLEIAVFDTTMLSELNNIGRSFDKKINVHLKIDTGLSRLGFLPHEVPAIMDMVQHLPYLRLAGVCSHFIEASNPEIVHQQEDLFFPFWQNNIPTHIANSNGSLNTKYEYDFVRIGAGIYGYLPEADPVKQQALQPIISLKTKIIGLKKVAAGKNVGYGSTTYITTRPSTVAVLACGYYDGIDPDISKFGKVIIHDEFAPIVGRINMNYFIVDVTDISQAAVHDTAIILGQSATKTISLYDWRFGAKKNVRMFMAKFNDSLPRIVVQQPIMQTLSQANTQSHTEL